MDAHMPVAHALPLEAMASRALLLQQKIGLMRHGTADNHILQALLVSTLR